MLQITKWTVVYVYETLTYSQKHPKDLPVLYTVAIEATPSRTSLTLLLQGNIKCHSFGLLLIWSNWGMCKLFYGTSNQVCFGPSGAWSVLPPPVHIKVFYTINTSLKHGNRTHARIDRHCQQCVHHASNAPSIEHLTTSLTCVANIKHPLKPNKITSGRNYDNVSLTSTLSCTSGVRR